MNYLRYIIFTLALVWSKTTLGQPDQPVRIHLLTNTYGVSDLYTTPNLYTGPNLDLAMPIKLSDQQYTLIELDTDTLTLYFPRRGQRRLKIPFERGKTYYYRFTGNTDIVNRTAQVPAVLQEMTERDFLLSVALSGVRYRHYSLTKKGGLQLLEKD